METFFDKPEMKDLKIPIFEYAAMKEKQETLKNATRIWLELCGDPREPNYGDLMEFILNEDGKIEPHERLAKEKRDTNNGCVWILTSGPSMYVRCGLEREIGEFCKFHADPPIKEDLRKIVRNLLGFP